MWALLAIIGLIVVLHFASKFLVRFGDFCNRLAESMGDYSVVVQKKPLPKSESSKDITDKIRTIKGEDSDDEYNEKIKREIEDLTDPEA